MKINKSMTENELINLLKKYDDAYYNGQALISDLEYDNFRDEVQTLYPNNSYFSLIGSDVKDKMKKVSLPYLLGSLKKFKLNTINKFFNKFSSNQEYCITDKLDGLSIYVEYNNGELIFASTRGNGEEGYEITKKARYFLPINISNKNKICLRGEVLLKQEEFEKLEFSNKRNGASGIINRDGYKDCDKLEIVFYEYINSENDNVIEDFEFINSLGLNVVHYEKIINPTKEQLTELLITRKVEGKYDIDGLVISPINYERENIYRPEYKCAFKVNQDGYEVTVDYIEWNVTRTGRIVPTVILTKPINIDGSNVSRVTAHNYEYVLNNKIGHNSIIKIVKSGDIIPYIVEIVKESENSINEIPKVCSSCEEEIFVEGVDLMCMNNNCPEKQIYFLDYFFKTLGAENISAQTFRNLNLYLLEDVFNITEEEIFNKEGFGKKSAKMIVSEIHNCLNTTPELFLAAIGIKNFGIKNCKKYIDSLDNSITSKEKFEKIFSINHSSFNKINGFGEKILNSVIYDLPRIAQIYKICLDNGLQFKKTDINLIQMKKITVTGKGPYPRKELEEKIKRMGYELINLSKESEMLVCADTSSTSNKMKKAQKLNIPIITYEEFFNV
jgi:DNA ligase (NAD+)